MVAGVAALVGLLYHRRRKQQPEKKRKPIDVDKLVVKGAFYVKLPPSEIKLRIEKLLEPESFLWWEHPSESVFEFRKNLSNFMRKTQPDRYREIVSKSKQNVNKVAEEIHRQIRFLSTTPEVVKVRILSEFQGEWYCEAECFPHLYFELMTGESVGDSTEREQTVKTAQNECRSLLEDTMANLSGRPATSPLDPAPGGKETLHC